GSGRTRFLWEGRDRIHNLPGTYFQFACEGCGTIFVHPQPDAGDLARHYPEDYEAYVTADREKRLKRIYNRLGAQRKANYAARFCAGGEILDIGCGRGDFIDAMRERGYGVHGIEYSRHGAETCRKRELDVTQGDFEGIPLTDSTYDLVTMWHVLEHLRDPARAVKRVAASLKPGGCFIFCFPNITALNRSVFGRLWAGYDVPRHLFTFSEKAVERMLGAADLAMEDRRTFFGYFSAFNYDVKFWSEEVFGVGVVSRTIRAITGSVFCRLLTAPLMFLTEKFGRGSVVTYAARKPGRT
ncbi:MAG: hypothetical protein DRP79_08015, partial [Planctomycetota bacterium]